MKHGSDASQMTPQISMFRGGMEKEKKIPFIGPPAIINKFSFGILFVRAK